jgi:hypothetical protein
VAGGAGHTGCVVPARVAPRLSWRAGTGQQSGRGGAWARAGERAGKTEQRKKQKGVETLSPSPPPAPMDSPPKKKTMGAAARTALRVFAGRSGSSGALPVPAPAAPPPKAADTAATPASPPPTPADRAAGCPPSTSATATATWEAATPLTDYADAAEVRFGCLRQAQGGSDPWGPRVPARSALVNLPFIFFPSLPLPPIVPPPLRRP